MDAKTESEIERAFGSQFKSDIKESITHVQAAVGRAREHAQTVIDTARSNEIEKETREINMADIRAAAAAAADDAARASNTNNVDAAKDALEKADGACMRMKEAVDKIAKLSNELNELRTKSQQ